VNDCHAAHSNTNAKIAQGKPPAEVRDGEQHGGYGAADIQGQDDSSGGLRRNAAFENRHHSQYLLAMILKSPSISPLVDAILCGG
jgi:hypothetical protein